MARLFKREVAVSFIRPTGFFTQEPNAVIVRDLRVEFSISKSLSKEPNTGEITIYNMAQQSRAEVQRRPLYIRLEAGFEDSFARLFEGDMRWAQSKLDSPNWVTKIEVGDGERAYRRARVSRSFRRGVKARDAIRELAQSMGLVVPKAVARKEFLREYAGGLTLQGPAHREMSRVLDSFDIGWSIQDGKLQILDDTETRFDEAVLVSEDTGMIGVPEISPPRKGKKKPSLSVRTLLEPRIRPGGRIVVRSRSVRGTYRVQQMRHVGDTFGDQFITEVEARPV